MVSSQVVKAGDSIERNGLARFTWWLRSQHKSIIIYGEVDVQKW